jgi:hypothetical protein
MSQIVRLLTELVLLGARILALYREAKRKEWIKEGKLISEALKDAKTDDDRAALARRLFDHRVR